LIAVKNNGLSLEWVSEEFYDDYDIGIAAYNQNTDAYQFLSKNIKKKICLY
jgi:hypothetical protein